MPDKPTYEKLKHTLDSDMLSASILPTRIQQQGFVNQVFTSLYKLYEQKEITHTDYVKLINRLGAYKQGAFNDYIDTLAGAASMGMLALVIQGEISQFTPEAAAERRDAVTDLTGVQPIDPDKQG